MRLVPVVLASLLPGMLLAAPPPAVAAGDLTCGGLPVTIDLNQVDHPHPDRPQGDVVLGTPRKDSIRTGAGNDVVCGGLRGDALDLGRGDDRAYAGHGNDHLVGAADDDVLRGGPGRDQASYVHAKRPTAVDLRVEGAQRTGSGRDILDGIEGVRGAQYFSNELTGDAGGNWFMGGNQHDRIEGGGGGDVIYTFATKGAEVYGGPGSDAISTYDGDDVIVGGGGDDRLWAEGGVDVVRGGDGDDLLMPGDGIPSGGLDRAHGGRGADVFLAAQYDELLAGGPGRDRVSYEYLFVRHHFGDGVVVDLEVEGPQDTRLAGLDELRSIEDLTGSEYDDQLLGDDLANLLQGGGGDDTLDGRGGTDVCEGGGGEDELVACETGDED